MMDSRAQQRRDLTRTAERLRRQVFAPIESGVPVAGRGGGGGVAAQQFVLVSVHGDYLTCHTWDGAAEGGTDVFVAKPYPLRRTPFDAQTIVIGGVSYTYDYADDQTRNVDDGTDNEDQQVTPGFYAGELIYAIQVTGGTDVAGEDDPYPAVTWQMIGDGRMWARSS